MNLLRRRPAQNGALQPHHPRYEGIGHNQQGELPGVFAQAELEGLSGED